MKCSIDMYFSASVLEGERMLRSYTFRKSVLSNNIPRVGDGVAITTKRGAVIPKVVAVTWNSVEYSAVAVVCEMGRGLTSLEYKIVVDAGWSTK